MQFDQTRFLLVDDHDFQRGMLARVLRQLGATDIAEAADGAAALAICTSGQPQIDIIICDLDMPGMDGMAFIRHLGESGLNAALILASALERSLIASVATMTKAYGMHLLGSLEKPVMPEQLKAVVEAYVRPAERSPRASLPARSFTVAEIREALTARQFLPLFQPKVDFSTGALKGSEALARWQHPQWGIVEPSAFIATLEANGLIDELSWLMAEMSARSCREWHAQGYAISISVNLSLSSLNQPHFADRFTELVRGQGLDPRHMILEVTESTAMTNVAQALENLTRFRVRGFGLSIDDYGTGYSSMQQLTRVPFTELKIDQSFVGNAATDETCRVVLESSLDMARRLRLSSVAEGVESMQDWELLQRLGCDLAQGYFIARPMPAEELIGWARNWKSPQAAAA